MTTPRIVLGAGARNNRRVPNRWKLPVVKRQPPTFSLLHATRGRPEKAVAAMRLWADRCSKPETVEYIRVCDSDDETAAQIAMTLDRRFSFCIHKCVEPRGSAPAWNEAYKLSSGHTLIQVSDDFEPPLEWNAKLLERIADSIEPCVERFVVAVGDGFRKDRLLTMLIASRRYCEMEGHFICPEYQSIHSDGDATIRAYKNAASGRTTVIEARDLVFEHRHAWRDKTVKWDRTYEMQNDPRRYEGGGKLFQIRNPDWETAKTASGEKIVDWL